MTIFVGMKIFNLQQKPQETTIHIISWFLIFVFPIMLTEWGKQFNWEEYAKHCLIPLSCFLIFYANYLYLIPRFLFQNKAKKYLLLNVLMVVIVSFFLHLGQDWLLPHPKGFRPGMPPQPPIWMHMGRHLTMLTFVVGLSAAIRISLRWQQTIEKLIIAENKKIEAELKNLKNQINPHFLLNTLNNIYALIAFDHEKAQEAVQKLSKLLRHMLYDNQSGLVSLEKELDFINNYIELMRIRQSKSVTINVHLDAGPKPLNIAPLVFISLIENAFKHGVSPTENCFIDISIQGYADGKIICEIKNSNHPKNATDKSGSGIGLEQVSRRLALSYPLSHQWEKGVNPDGTIYTSRLTIQTFKS